MGEAVDALIRDLMLNLDEIGASEWEDRKTRPVVFPPSLRSQTIHHGVNRNPKHVTIVTCVAASGEHLIPYLLTSQDSKPSRVDLQIVF
jgi:hypothetical protein